MTFAVAGIFGGCPLIWLMDCATPDGHSCPASAAGYQLIQLPLSQHVVRDWAVSFIISPLIKVAFQFHLDSVDPQPQCIGVDTHLASQHPPAAYL